MDVSVILLSIVLVVCRYMMYVIISRFSGWIGWMGGTVVSSGEW